MDTLDTVKVLVLALLLHVGTSANGVLTNSFAKVSTSVHSLSVKAETANLAKSIFLDGVGDNNRAPASEDTNAYAKEDIWGVPYQIIKSDERVLVTSAGPDRVFGTGDDIISSYGIEHPKRSDPLLAYDRGEELAFKHRLRVKLAVQRQTPTTRNPASKERAKVRIINGAQIKLHDFS